MPRILLKEVMARKRVNKAELARRLRVHPSSVFRFFRPGYDPKLSMLMAWARALECHLFDLIETD